MYLPASSYKLQSQLDSIADWTDKNIMLLNEDKCYYRIFSRSDENFTTRLNVNEKILQQEKTTKFLAYGSLMTSAGPKM